MKTPALLLLPSLLLTCLPLTSLPAQAQDPPPGVQRNEIKLPPSVVGAAVRREKVVSGGAGGGSLTIQVIDAPALPPAVPTPATGGELRLTPEQRAALRAAAPEMTRWFSPHITVYPNGVSHVSWSALDLGAGEGHYEAWLNMDLSAFEFMQDVTVGKTRFVVMPLMMDYRWRSIPKRNPPAPAEFKNPREVMVDKGDAQNLAALAPLNAMLSLYAEKGAELVASAQVRKAELAAITQWERLHPSPKPSVTIKVCPLDSLPVVSPAPTPANPTNSAK